MNAITPSAEPASAEPSRDLAPLPDASSAPPFTHGFGVLMEQELTLQSTIDETLLTVNQPHSADICRILENHRVRVAAGVSLLEQRCNAFPHPSRFHALIHHRSRVGELSGGLVPVPSHHGLADLIAQHARLAASIDTLIEEPSNTEPVKLNLAEVARNHEEMAWMLTALIKEDETLCERGSPQSAIPPLSAPTPASAVSPPAPITPVTPGTTEGGWENEGGAQPEAASPGQNPISAPTASP